MASIQDFSQEFLLQAHQVAATPSVILLYFIMIGILFVCGLFIARSSAKFWSIFALVAILGAIATYGIIMMPNAVQFIASFFMGPSGG